MLVFVGLQFSNGEMVGFGPVLCFPHVRYILFFKKSENTIILLYVSPGV